MREVCYYVAYDGEEFSNREDCLEYEKETLDKFQALDACYTFLDINKNQICPPQNDDLDEWFHWGSIAFSACGWIYRHNVLPENVNRFIHTQFGYCIENEDFVNNELGLFKWNDQTIEWEKVDE